MKKLLLLILGIIYFGVAQAQSESFTFEHHIAMQQAICDSDYSAVYDIINRAKLPQDKKREYLVYAQAVTKKIQDEIETNKKAIVASKKYCLLSPLAIAMTMGTSYLAYICAVQFFDFFANNGIDDEDTTNSALVATLSLVSTLAAGAKAYEWTKNGFVANHMTKERLCRALAIEKLLNNIIN